MEIPQDWHLNNQHRDAKKYNEMLSAQARKLSRALAEATSDDDKHAAVYNYYRKFYTLTLTKSCQEAGVNKSPARDMILDYPWKDLNLDRIFCLKIWEKINH
jgi:hypothetical protein